jgi:hypothetical protein
MSSTSSVPLLSTYTKLLEPIWDMSWVITIIALLARQRLMASKTKTREPPHSPTSSHTPPANPSQTHASTPPYTPPPPPPPLRPPPLTPRAS